MTRDTALQFAASTSQVPDYRGPAGEQAFYEALTVNFDWFEREMKALRKLVQRERQPARRVIAASH